MLALEEAELKLKDLKQAIALEQQRQYINLQGKKLLFSQFLMQTVVALAPWLEPNLPEWDRFMNQVRQYDYMDLMARKTLLDKLNALLNTPIFSVKPTAKAPTRKTLTNAPHVNDPAKTEVQYVKGIGPRLASVLNRANIYTVEDLLYYFPRKYLDYHNRLKIAQLTVGQEATIIGTIQGVNAYNTKNNKLSIVSVPIKDETGIIIANWILAKSNRNVLESMKGRFIKGMEVMISGKVKFDTYKNKLAIDRPEMEVLSYADADDPGSVQSLHAGRIVPVYALVEGLNLKVLRKAIRQALTDFLPNLADPLPEHIRRQYGLIDLQHAMEHVHFPESFEHYETARRRLVFDELFYVQVRLGLLRSQYKLQQNGLSLKFLPNGIVSQFLSQLPFTLTNAQKRVFEEIQADMATHEPMYRLLQGDVGSGKTIVAILTLLIAIENGYQGVLMAPTEILAEQHYRNAVHWLTPLGLKVGLVVGKAGSKERREVRQGLANGQIHLAVGTHALIQEGVEFSRLGAIVVDEQHRFGVKQRVMLKNKGENPEMLTMTATPIPRTLAMTLHGDLDVSVLDELPPGRTPIKTVLFRGKSQRDQAYQLIKSEVVSGRQVYIVFPLIEESESISAKAATAEYERLRQTVFPELKMGLLHGKLPSEEKDGVMNAFKAKELDILVSTTVIEVGVDVLNATVMLIENADRFGLAQLHQLRGRVGRGANQSYCLLMTDSRTDETLKRLNILVESTDGFYIAEQDMALRGPGDFLGTRQSGLPDFALADLINDRAILEDARKAAFSLIADNADLTQYPELHDVIFTRSEAAFAVVTAG